MADAREAFLRDLQTKLVDRIPAEHLPTVIGAVTLALKKYNMEPTCEALAIPDDKNAKLIKMYTGCLYVDGKRERTIKTYSYTISKFANTVGKPLTDVSAYDIRFYLANEKQRGVSGSSLENIRSYLSSFYQWMVAEELIAKSPMAAIKPIKYTKEQEKPFSDIEIDKLRNAVGSAKERAMLEVLITTGVRVSELVQLDVSDVDFKSRAVNIRDGKGGKQRTVYMSSVALSHLERYLNGRTDGALFVSSRGDRYTISGVEKMLRTLGKQAGVTNVHPHRFRHTFATTAANQIPVQNVQKLLGHSNMQTTMIYVTVDDREVETKAKQIAF